MEALIGQEGDHLKVRRISYNIFMPQELAKVVPVGGGRVGSNPGGGTEKSILPSTWEASYSKKGHMASAPPCLGRLSFHGSSLEFRSVQAPAESFFDNPLHQKNERPFEREAALKACLLRSLQESGWNQSGDQPCDSVKF